MDKIQKIEIKETYTNINSTGIDTPVNNVSRGCTTSVSTVKPAVCTCPKGSSWSIVSSTDNPTTIYGCK